MGFITDEKRTSQHRDNPILCNDWICDLTYVSNGKSYGPVDLLPIAVKYPVLMESLESVWDFVRGDTIILSLLNGTTSEGITKEALGRDVMLHLIAQPIDSVKAGDQVEYTGAGEIVTGTNDEGKEPQLREVGVFFRKNGVPHHVAEGIIYRQWGELMLNCDINQICAVYDIPHRGCQSDQPCREEFQDTIEEVRRITMLERIPLKETDIERWSVAVDGPDAGSTPSMHQDMLARQKAEIDLFSRATMELARKYGTEAPLNTKLYQEIEESEENFR